jgi:hypothetical protein
LVRVAHRARAQPRPDRQVINDLNVRDSLGDDAKPVRVVDAYLDGPGLAARFRDMKVATRAELRACDRPLDATLLVTAVRGSCERVHGQLILDLWPEIEPNRSRRSEISGGRIAA